VPVPNRQWITSDDGQRDCPKHVEFHTRINLEISATFGFYLKKGASNFVFNSVIFRVQSEGFSVFLTLNLLTTTIVAPPSNASKWQMGFNSAFKGLVCKYEYSKEA
jgi:hypothetical protein